jgi:hypothetical protein
MVAEVCPLAFEAWQDYEYEAESLSYHDMAIVQELMKTMAENSERHNAEDFFPGQDATKEYAEAHGISVREVRELFNKLSGGRRDRRDFKLDFSQAKPPSYFYQQAEAAVPDIKQ